MRFPTLPRGRLTLRHVGSVRDRPARRLRPVGRTAKRRALRTGRAVVGLVAAILLVLGATGAGWLGHRRAEQRDAAVRQSLATATAAAKAIFSYDYRTFDTSVANGQTFVTGSFAEEYAQTTAALKQTALSERAVVVAEVSATGVVSASAERVELLLYLNQYRRNVNTDGEKVDQNRVVVTMVAVGGEWKVAAATAI